MLTESKCEKVIEEAVALAEKMNSRKRPIALEATVTSEKRSTSRFAENLMTQNQTSQIDQVSLRLLADGEQVRVSGEKLDRRGLEELIERALVSTSLMKSEDKTAATLPKAPNKGEGKKLPRFQRFDEKASAVTADDRAAMVLSAIEVAARKGANLAGIVSTNDLVLATGNSRRLFQFARQTELECSVTAMCGDSTGWAKAFSTRLDIDMAALADRAVEKAISGRAPKDIAPGKYPVILEASAVLDLLAFLWWDFSATSHLDELSALRGKLGQKLFSEKFSACDDYAHSEQYGAPFDGIGLPRQKVALVENGIFKGIVTSRTSAAKLSEKTGLDFAVTNHALPEPNTMGEMPQNIVVAGGDCELDDLLKGSSELAREAILLTRVWYVREVDPSTKLLTGMTRDGTFIVRNGVIAEPVKNLRFNVSLFDLLNSIVSLGRSRLTAGEEGIPAVVPPMLVQSFNFTEMTRF